MKGGIRITESAKLIFRVKKNGTRKKTNRKSSGGRMMSQRHAVPGPVQDGRANRRPLRPCRRINSLPCQPNVNPPLRPRGRPGSGRARRSRQRQRLIDACIAALHLYGPSRTTVEKVVAIADLSPGIVRFYFDSKDAMLVASLGYLAAEFEERVLVPVARLKDSPVRALELLVDLYLDPEIASTRKISVWYSFWGEASSRQEYLDICGKKDEDFAVLVRELMERLIAETGARHLDADGVALGLIGVLEMLWQGVCLPERGEHRPRRRARALARLSALGVPGQVWRGTAVAPGRGAAAARMGVRERASARARARAPAATGLAGGGSHGLEETEGASGRQARLRRP